MIHVFAKVSGKLALWTLDGDDHVEAIEAVKAETPAPAAPVLALILGGQYVASSPKPTKPVAEPVAGDAA